MTDSTKNLKDIAEEAKGITCSASRALYFVREFLRGPMCGKCFPCSFGAYEAMLRLKDITSGTGGQEDIDAIRGIAEKMLVMSMCKKGKDTAEYMIECLGAPDFGNHVVTGTCEHKVCKAFIEYRNVPENCIRCGACQDACKFDAIHGEKQVSYKCCYLPFEIRQRRCVKCGECIKVCPSKAIVVVNIEHEPQAVKA
jgi:NADH-quinone oxidoreductase subunit F